MASAHPGAQSSGSGGAGDVSPGGSGAGPATNPKMRKRTKTGCLTCRKRRIKCGEERPTCANCIKSKRQCEGYNQRVVFKPPIGDWPNHPGVVNTMPYHNSMLPGARTTYRGHQNPGVSQDGSLSSIQPRPMTQFDFSNVETGPIHSLEHLNTQQHVLVGGTQPYHQDQSYQQPLPSPHHQAPLHSPHHQQPLQSPHHQQQPLQSPHNPLPTPTSATSYFPSQPSPAHATFPGTYAHSANVGYEAQPRYPPSTQYQQIPISYDGAIDQKPTVSQASHEQPGYQHSQRSEEHNHFVLPSHAPPRTEGYAQHLEQRPTLNRYGSNPQIPTQPQLAHVDYSQGAQYAPLSATSHSDSTHSHSSFQPVQIPSHDLSPDVKYMPQHAPVLEQPIAVSKTRQNIQPQLLLSGFAGDDHVSPTQVLDEAAVEQEDDDYYDVQSDEEMLEDEDRDEDAMILSRDFSLIQRIHRENTNDLDIRRYDAFIYEGILSHYRTEYVANPLKNPKTARVFAHFIHVTGPTLSIYERNPRNPSSLYEGPIPPSHQSLWTYILPLRALNNQGLLHAMLALASLHIAKLQKASVTPSYKHYAYALKRLGRSLGNPKKRLQVPTLATSLLLAFYEVMTAEHVKWSTHLVGAAHLLAELDFRTLTQEARHLKAAQTAQEQQFPYENPDMLIDQKQFEQRLKECAMMPDESMVSTIVGKKVNYDDFGRVFEEGSKQQDRRGSTREKLDLRGYETLQDLYWWYARQDLFQSIVSGNPLIMDYRRWSDCAPRAPLGRTDALYGSHDHIVLLIGRIADYIVRDRARKLRQVEANGGQWRPTPGMPGMGSMGPPPSQGQAGRGQPPTPTTPMGPPPHMQGMGPPPGWTGGPPPGWTGPPPPGWKGGPPPTSPAGPPPTGQGPPQMGPPQGEAPRGPPTAGPGFYGMAPSRGPISLPPSYANPDHVKGDSPQSPNTPHPKFSDLPAAYEAALTEWNSISAAHAAVAQFLSNTPTFAPLTPDQTFAGPGGNMTPFGPTLLYRSYDIGILWALLHLAQILLLRSHPGMPPAAMVAAQVCAPATQPYAILIGRIAAGLSLPMTEETPLTPSLGAALIESTMSLFFAGIQYQDAAQRDWLVTRLLEIDRRTGWASAGVIARSCETSWQKAAELGRGPPYARRKTRPFGEDGPVALDADGSGEGGWGGERIFGNASERRGMQRDGRPPREDWESQDKRFVVKYRTGFVPWAMNVLATEEDLRVGMERVGLNGEINVAGTERESNRAEELP